MPIKLLRIEIVGFCRGFGNILWRCYSAKWPFPLDTTRKLMASLNGFIGLLNRSCAALWFPISLTGLMYYSKQRLLSILLYMLLISSPHSLFYMGMNLGYLSIWLYKLLGRQIIRLPATLLYLALSVLMLLRLH